MTKPNKIKFKKLMDELMGRYGVVHTPKQWYSMSLATRAGPLGITFYDHISSRGMQPWIATRFDDAKKASKYVDVNPYNGKWNHHFPDGWTPQECVDAFESALKRIL